MFLKIILKFNPNYSLNFRHVVFSFFKYHSTSASYCCTFVVLLYMLYFVLTPPRFRGGITEITPTFL